MRSLIGQQAVDRNEQVLGTVTDQYVEDAKTWVVIDDDYEFDASGCEEIIDLTGQARVVNPELKASYIRFGNQLLDNSRRDIQKNVGWQAVLAQEPTPRQIEATMTPRCPKPGETERLYEARDAFIDALKEKGSIEITDLANLDRLGRFKVADECWEISTAGARKAMLNDPHHQVRSAATISQQQESASVKEFELGVSDSYKKSYSDAVDVACKQKESANPVLLNLAQRYDGKVIEVTEHHVVQSLGRTAAIHEKRNLDRVPEKDEVLTIAYDGIGQAKVESKSQDKSVSR